MFFINNDNSVKNNNNKTRTTTIQQLQEQQQQTLTESSNTAVDDLIGGDEDFPVELPHQRRLLSAVRKNGTRESRRQVLVQRRNLREKDGGLRVRGWGAMRRQV